MWNELRRRSVSYTHLDVYKRQTLYYLITDEEFENETLAIDFHYYGSPCKGTLAIVHEPEEN